MHSGHRPRFLCDNNLGRLAKWLRILGFDTLYMKNMREDIIEEERLAGRIILTRSGKLSSHQKGFSLIKSNCIADQIKEVNDKFLLDKQLKPFSLCVICNEPLVFADNLKATGHVPEYVLSIVGTFWNCQKCNKFYWQGSHIKRVNETIQNLLE
jgi:uncharacterized protein with PIN domain